MKKFLITSLISLMLAANVSADTDGENNFSKKNSSQVKDCFESLNRATFALNQGLDNVIFEPIAKAYRILPSPVRSGTSNALDNLSTLVTIPNNVLQGDFKKAGINTGRFIINTTLGIAGIFDLAQKIGFPDYEKEDYGQTLGAMGVGEGCYLVLPVLGPSTVRDTAGSFVIYWVEMPGIIYLLVKILSIFLILIITHQEQVLELILEQKTLIHLKT